MPKVSLGTKRDPRELETKVTIKDGLIRTGISQKQLAEKIGVTESTLSRHCSKPRNMRLGELWDIQDKLKISSDELTKIFK